MRKQVMSMLLFFVLTAVLVLFVSCTQPSAETDTDTPVTETDSKKSSDWLILMYADGDNSLNDAIFSNVQQFCSGLYDIRNSDGSAVSGYDSVQVVVLWDGIDNSLYNTTCPGYSGSYLWEMQRGRTIAGTSSLYKTDVSSTASWLTDSSGNQEVNMGSKDTLANFLTWAAGRYTAAHTILVLSDHGGGPHTSVSGSSNIAGLSPSICWDDTTNDAGCIETTDLPLALAAAGYGTANKIDIIAEDVCLASTLEELYELKDYAGYLLSSPNLMPGSGLNYQNILYMLTDDSTVLSVGEKEVASYRWIQAMSSSEWASCLSYVQTNYDSTVTASTISLLNYDNYLVRTLTFCDLSKADALAAAVNTAAGVINAGTSEQQTYIKTNFVTHSAAAGNTICYKASWVYTYDIGYLAYELGTYASAQSWTDLTTAVTALESALSDVVAASWRDGLVINSSGNVTDSGRLYFNTGSKVLDNTAPFGNNWFGIAIGAGLIKSTASEYYPAWYGNLDFSKTYTNWNTFLSNNYTK